jgi:hypothetical protein
MSTSLTTNQKTARKKGMTAAVVAGASGLALAFGPAVLGIIGLVGAGVLTYDWFMFRAKRGMRF